MRYVIRTILIGYFLFALSRIVSLQLPDLLARLHNLTCIDWLAVGFLPAALLVYHYCRSGLSNAEKTAVVFALLTVLFVFLTRMVAAEYYVILVGYFATIGWLYTNYINRINQQQTQQSGIIQQRKSHTMTVLIQMRNSSEFQSHRINLFSRHPPGKPVKPEHMENLKRERSDPSAYLPKEGKIPAMDSAIYMLNYYEFISVGVLANDLDEDMIKKTLGAIFVNFHEHVYPIIEDASKDDMGKENIEIYKNYKMVVAKFTK